MIIIVIVVGIYIYKKKKRNNCKNPPTLDILGFSELAHTRVSGFWYLPITLYAFVKYLRNNRVYNIRFMLGSTACYGYYYPRWNIYRELANSNKRSRLSCKILISVHRTSETYTNTRKRLCLVWNTVSCRRRIKRSVEFFFISYLRIIWPRGPISKNYHTSSLAAWTIEPNLNTGCRFQKSSPP